MNYELVIFDWDGTLMDSTARIVDCLTRAAGELGLPELAEERYRSIIGLGLPEAIRELYPAIDEATVQAMRQGYATHFVAAEREPSSLFPGARALLDHIAGSASRMAVATGKSRRGLDRVWGSTDLGRYFQASRCADESGSKPDPAMLYELLEELRVPSHRAVMVGDTSFDLEMAQRAGIDRIAVNWGAHRRERMLPFQPLAFADTFDELFFLLTGPQSGLLKNGA